MGKNVKRRKFRLKKRARKTIASLLVVSAVVVSLIPIKEKTQAYVDPETDTTVKPLNKVLEEDYMFTDTDLEVVAPSGATEVYAFPYAGAKFGPDNDPTILYYEIDPNGIDTVDDKPVPVFNVRNPHTSAAYLHDFYGYKAEFNGNVNLHEGVCYINDSTQPPKSVSFNRILEDGKTHHYSGTYVSSPVSANDVKLPSKFYRFSEFIIDTDENGNEISQKVRDFYATNDASRIQYICDGAFAGQKGQYLNKIDLSQPELMKIGNSAFKGCRSLKEISLYNKVSSIGREAFRECSGLKSVTFSGTVEDTSGASLEKIGDGAFANCIELTSIRLPSASNELKLGAGVFYGCTQLTEINDSDMFVSLNNPVSIGPYAFANDINETEAPKLSKVKMYRNLKPFIRDAGSADPLGSDFDGLFAGCTNLTEVELPESYGSDNDYTSLDNAHKLGRYMFQNCKNLTRVRFYGSNAAPYNDYQFVTKSSLPYALKDGSRPEGAPAINEKTQNIDDESFVIEGPDPDVKESAAHVSARKFSNTYKYADQEKYERVQGDYSFVFDGGIITGISSTVSSDDVLSIPPQLGKNSITTIGDKAYKVQDINKDPVRIIIIPENIEYIGEKAFANIPKLRELYIDTKGVMIREEAFADNKELLYVRFKQKNGEGATNIKDRCFYNCEKLLEVDFRVKEYNSSGDETYDVNVQEIGPDAFRTNRQKAFSDRDDYSYSKAELYRAVKDYKLNLNRLGSEQAGVDDIWLIMKGKMDPS